MSSLSSQPTGLPIVGQPTERSDAAANRERILCAARRVLEQHGAAGLSMNAVAAAAGVGKGTIFRRFGDRDGLTTALLDAHTVQLQDGFLTGPPPLGPGAPPRERLEAFMRELVAFTVTHLETVLAARGSRQGSTPVHGTFVLHVHSLIEQVDPRLDAPIVAGLLVSAVRPGNVQRLIAVEGADAGRVADGVVALLRGLTGPPDRIER
jgi:AcrR family transcriptional regulator